MRIGTKAISILNTECFFIFITVTNKKDSRLTYITNQSINLGYDFNNQ